MNIRGLRSKVTGSHISNLIIRLKFKPIELKFIAHKTFHLQPLRTYLKTRESLRTYFKTRESLRTYILSMEGLRGS